MVDSALHVSMQQKEKQGAAWHPASLLYDVGSVLLFSYLDAELILVGALVDGEQAALSDIAIKDMFADDVFNVVLDGTLQRAGTELHVVALRGDKLLGGIGELQLVAHAGDALVEAVELDVDDALDGIEVELVEGDDFVETVEGEALYLHKIL